MRAGNTQREEKNKVDTKYKKDKIKMIIWIIVFIIVLYQTIKLGLYTLGKIEKDKMWLYNSVNSVVELVMDRSNKEVVEDNNVKFASLGDIYLTNSAIKSAKDGNSYDFTSNLANIKKVLSDYDIVAASLNTPIAGSKLGYTSKNVYNAPTELLKGLKDVNISVLAAATSHINDKKQVGIENTIQNIEENEIKYTGIGEDNVKPLVIEKNNIKIGIISYASEVEVKLTNKKLVNIISEDKIKEDIKYLNDENVDFIIAYLNTADNQTFVVSGEQKTNTELLFSNGVNVVFGSGSMVVQEQLEEEIELNDSKHHIYSVYSLGSFMGSSDTTENRISILTNLEFTKKVVKDKKGNVKSIDKNMVVKDPIYLYTYMDKVGNNTIYTLDNLFEEKESGKITLTDKEYKNIKSEEEKLDKLFK